MSNQDDDDDKGDDAEENTLQLSVSSEKLISWKGMHEESGEVMAQDG